MDIVGAQFRVQGLVQGVGFRPTVWRLATRLGLNGDVLNDASGVLIHAWGTDAQLRDFEAAILREPPPLARITSIERSHLVSAVPPQGFHIAQSRGGTVSTGIVADAATCHACIEDIRDPTNRRYRYAFTNCTHCGPRLSIVRAIPYDRATTSMAAFVMCPDCQAEYDDPHDRRFHAEPNACPACGPQVWLEDENGRISLPAQSADVIDATAHLIKAGSIVAIKGIGGFHLACDATNAEAVARLRQRKRRYHKPFALMARDATMVADYAHLTAADEKLLMSAAAPIVLIEQAQAATTPPLAPDLAPGQTALGFMLPYTPLHHLLMQALEFPIVLTSGNTSNEPQAIRNDDARARLAGIADVWLMHDRDIVNRLDDSVARVADGKTAVIRRARGYAPQPLPLAEGFAGPRVLALGAELKSTFCLATDKEAILSQHIGDLEDAATHDDFRHALQLYRQLFRFDPDVIAVDFHPEYLSTKWGQALAHETGARLVSVQHHHAHVAAVLAEHRLPADTPPVLGIVLDGLGMGADGALWGGEFLACTYRDFSRLASFPAVPLIGGDRATREPWRNAFAHLNAAFGWQEIASRFPQLEIIKLIESRQPAVLTRMAAQNINAPPASSAGRLFDAAAAMLGICTGAVSYEGQAAIELEARASQAWPLALPGYAVECQPGDPIRLSFAPLWPELLGDLAHGVPHAIIAARFHQGLIDAISGLAARLAATHNIKTVVLAGGVFQNRILLSGVTRQLTESGHTVLAPEHVPANDAGISLGQAVYARLT